MTESVTVGIRTENGAVCRLRNVDDGHEYSGRRGCDPSDCNPDVRHE